MSIVQDFFARLHERVVELQDIRQEIKEVDTEVHCPISDDRCDCEANDYLQTLYPQEIKQIQVIKDYLNDFYEMLEWRLDTW